MRSDESITLARITKILLRKKINKIYLLDDRVIYLCNRYLCEFSLIVEDYSSFYYTEESHPSISVYHDGTIIREMFFGSEKELLHKAKIVYNILVDSLKLEYFWKEIKR